MRAAPARVVVAVAGLLQPRWGRPYRGTQTLGWAGEWLSAPLPQAAAIPEWRGQGAWGDVDIFILTLERSAGAIRSCQKAVLTRGLAGSSERAKNPESVVGQVGAAVVRWRESWKFPWG